MATAAEQVSSTPAPPEVTEPPTLLSVMRDNHEELAEDIVVLGDGAVGDDRAKDIVFADLLLKRLAGVESHTSTLRDAMKQEVELITRRYETVIQQASKRVGFMRFMLEGIARVLFTDPTAKSKSLNLPYGTLGRKDFKPVPELVDEDVAVQYARLLDRSKVKVTISCSLDELEDRLVTLVRRAEKKNGTLTQIVRDYIDGLLAPPVAGDGLAPSTLRAKLEIMWGALKKEPAVDLYTMVRNDINAAAPPVKWTEPVAVYTVQVTEARS